MKKIVSIILTFVMILSVIPIVQAADFSGGGYNFVCAEGGRYLNVYAGKDADGTNVCVWERDGSPEQNYTISSVGGGKYKLYPACSSSRVIDVNRGNSYNNPLRAGLNVDLWRTNDAPAQEFYITHVGNNLYKIELAVLGGHVLQANNPYSNNGNVTLEAYTGASNQHWKILKDGYEVTEPCTHVNVSNKNETRTISQKDDSVHTIVKIYDKICNDCGALISSGIKEMSDASHSFSVNKCLECGYEMIKTEENPTENNPAQEPVQCKHEKTYTTENSVTYGYPEPNGKVKDDEYHIGYYYADEYCLECKALINKKIIIEKESLHTYWNDTCTGCLHKRKVEVPERIAYVCNTDGDNLNMRSQASTSSSIIAKIPAGATISVTGDAVGGFYPVKYNGQTGYASADYITFTKPQTNKTAYVYNTDGANLNMRSGASTKTSIVTKIPAGSTITVTGDATNGFYPVKYGIYSGYASTSYITFTKPAVSVSVGDNLSGSVGKRLANFNGSAYNASSPLKNYKGQCTWYCWGRAYEKTGIRLNTVNNAKTWLSRLNTAGTQAVWNSYAPRKNSIAVKTSGTYGHVLFIEDVIGDTVYYTEANVPWNDVLDATDGVLKKTTKANMAKMCNGYIYLN